MYTEVLKEDFSGIRIELIDLNTSTYFYVTKANRFKYLFQNTTRKFVIEEFTSLRYLENGIILHLTKLDDEKAEYSFQTILKKLNKLSVDQKKLKILTKRIKQYRQKINFLKNEHRNLRIAHLNTLKYPEIDDFLNFEEKLKPLILEANEIGDFLFNKKLGYRFKLGSLEGYLDYRKPLEKMEIDFKSTDEL
ncbi:hypothetical protein [uncultured Winogradskyella sp.]|uniref:hypothetical protein n=1 Tax=uncultured Winogradskyella sp. TaxID=395353 RepID=UPI0030DAF12D|tara:strand:- start:139503 stop:140078 length:576 start_codon:yes stop_codon:yes gene_type:complete